MKKTGIIRVTEEVYDYLRKYAGETGKISPLASRILLEHFKENEKYINISDFVYSENPDITKLNMDSMIILENHCPEIINAKRWIKNDFTKDEIQQIIDKMKADLVLFKQAGVKMIKAIYED